MKKQTKEVRAATNGEELSLVLSVEGELNTRLIFSLWVCVRANHNIASL